MLTLLQQYCRHCYICSVGTVTAVLLTLLQLFCSVDTVTAVLFYWHCYSCSVDFVTAVLLTLLQLFCWHCYSCSVDTVTTVLLTLLQLFCWHCYSCSVDTVTAVLFTMLQRPLSHCAPSCSLSCSDCTTWRLPSAWCYCSKALPASSALQFQVRTIRLRQNVTFRSDVTGIFG